MGRGGVWRVAPTQRPSSFVLFVTPTALDGEVPAAARPPPSSSHTTTAATTTTTTIDRLALAPCRPSRCADAASHTSVDVKRPREQRGLGAQRKG